MALKDLVASVFYDEAIWDVDFAIDRLRIRPAAFIRIRDLIENEAISVSYDPALSDHSEYDRADNSLHIPRVPFNEVLKANIVHEAVHALCDESRARTTVWGEECAAYIAEMTFAGTKGWRITGLRQEDVAVREEASLLAGRVQQQRGIRFSHAAVSQLRSLISRHPRYRGQTGRLVSDGIQPRPSSGGCSIGWS